VDAAQAVAAALETLYPRSWPEYVAQAGVIDAWTAEVARRAEVDPWTPILYHAQGVIGGDGGSFNETVPEGPIQPWPANTPTLQCARCGGRFGYVMDDTLQIPFEHKLGSDGTVSLRHKLTARVVVVPLGRHREVGTVPHIIKCPRHGHANRLVLSDDEWHAVLA